MVNINKRIRDLKSELDGIAAQALEEGRYDIEAKANRAFYDFDRPENKSALPMNCCASCDAGYHEHSLAPGAKCDCYCHGGNDLQVAPHAVQPSPLRLSMAAELNSRPGIPSANNAGEHSFTLDLARLVSFSRSGDFAEAR